MEEKPKSILAGSNEFIMYEATKTEFIWPKKDRRGTACAINVSLLS